MKRLLPAAALCLGACLTLWAALELAGAEPRRNVAAQNPPRWSVPELEPEPEPEQPARPRARRPKDRHGRHYSQLPEGLALVVRQRLWITNGRLMAPLPSEVQVEGLQQVTLAADRRRVEVSYVDFCLGLHQASYRLAALKARLASEEGLNHFRAGRLAKAESSFRQALRLDPALQQTALNLAATLMRRERPTQALATLAPFFQQAADDLYLNLLLDHLLTPLLERPQIQGLRSEQPGRAVLSFPLLLWGRNDLFSGYHLAVRHRRDALAVIQRQLAWGSSNWHSTLQILSLPDKRVLAQLQLVLPHETHPRSGKVLRSQRPAIQRRLELANRFLVDRGFTVPAGLQRALVQQEGARWQAAFPGSRLALELADGQATVASGQSKLFGREVPPLKRLEWASYLPSLQLLAYGWSRAAREGCEGFDPEGVELLSPPSSRTAQTEKQRPFFWPTPTAPFCR